MPILRDSMQEPVDELREMFSAWTSNTTILTRELVCTPINGGYGTIISDWVISAKGSPPKATLLVPINPTNKINSTCYFFHPGQRNVEYVTSERHLETIDAFLTSCLAGATEEVRIPEPTLQ